jgi:CRP-like cAMP-binding protein
VELAFINEMKRDHLRCPPGTEIIAAGQEQAELYTLYSGWAFRFKMLPDGRRQILNIILPGDLVGLQGAMFEAAAYGVEALTEVEICVLPRRKVWSLFQNMPELSFDVTWLGAREESHVDENLTSVGRRSAAESIAALIIQLYKRLEALGMVVNSAMPFPLTQQHIADLLGLSLVHTNKSLAKLRRLGMFTQTNGMLLLGNPRALESMAQHFEEETPKRPLI